jgi:hypothetical protein
MSQPYRLQQERARIHIESGFASNSWSLLRIEKVFKLLAHRASQNLDRTAADYLNSSPAASISFKREEAYG